MKIVLAYSGGLDTSVALHWLRERYDAQVIAYCADLGQPGSMEDVRRRALAGGAAEAIVEDQRERYLDEFVFPALRANAAYEDRYLLAAPLGRPLIGERLVEVAHAQGADAVAHGATGKGNDWVRFYTAVVAGDPALQVLAPAAEWELVGREEELRYARRHGIELTDAADGTPYSIDGSVWGTSIECGSLEDPGYPAPPDAWRLTRGVEHTPDAHMDVEIAFEQGLPVALDGTALNPLELVQRLAAPAGEHGIGRVDMVESSVLGIKTRALYESPAGAVLHAAHRELESLCLDRDTLRFKSSVDRRYAELVYDGLWFTPLRRALQRFVEDTQQRVSGSVTMRLHRGTASVHSRSSPHALFDPTLSTHGPQDDFEHRATAGFSYIWSMPSRLGR